MKSIAALLLGTSIGLSAVLHAQTPAVSVSKPAYKAGENIVVTFTNGPANAKDWIGIYPSSVQPSPSSPSTIWFYVDGTKNGENGVASGTITFTNGLATAGSWIAYLLENDGYTALASAPFTTLPAPSVTASKNFYQTNETITITFANGPGNAKDWIGVYPEGVTPGGPASTIWNYVSGTQSATTGLTNGTIVFTNGLPTAGKWVAYFLENDDYSILASTKFTVGSVPALAPEHSTYPVGSAITLHFTNGPANAKDWIGLYPEGSLPGGPAATVWQYTDASGGQTGKSSGSITFQSGLTNAGVYVSYFLQNDGHGILASNRVNIVAADAPILWLDKRSYTTREPIVAAFTNAPGNARDWVGIYPAGVVPGTVNSTIWSYLDGAGTEPVLSGTVRFDDGLARAGEWVAYLLENDVYTVLAQESFTVIERPRSPTNNIVLGTPVHFENFDSTPEGELPAGWTTVSYTDALDETLDLGDLNSKSYANWLVVSANRFNSPLLSYTAHRPTDDYKRVLSTNLENVVNGVVVTNLASGNILFANSGYRDGRSQVLYVFTPDYDLTGRTNVHLSFHSLYEQNEDSIGALEYSVDRGTNWLPVIYLLDRRDVLTNETRQVDAVATFTTEYPDVAYYDDPVTGETKGGTYGTFIGAPVNQTLAPFISGRIDNDAIGSKRVEFFRLPRADKQPAVRFRFAYAGTDSWYWGVDNFGIYAGPTTSTPRITLSATRAGQQISVSWTGGTGQLQKSSTLAPGDWRPVQVATGATSVTEPADGRAGFYRVVEQ